MALCKFSLQSDRGMDRDNFGSMVSWVLVKKTVSTKDCIYQSSFIKVRLVSGEIANYQ